MSPFNLTEEKIMQILKEKFEEKHLMRGQESLADFCVENILVTADKKFLYRCSDPSRNHFIYLDEKGKIQKDINGHHLIQLINEPVRQRTRELYQECSDRYFDSENNEEHSENDQDEHRNKNNNLNEEEEKVSPTIDEDNKKLNKQPVKKGRPSRKNENNNEDENEDEEKVTKGTPKYRVVSFNGEELAVRKLYTSNIGPKNAAQKAFNRMCDKLNEKMEISVEKLGDKSGKIMTYFFMKQELDPPIERMIGGKKVVYRNKTVSC
jgi:hypothetical protein